MGKCQAAVKEALQTAEEMTDKADLAATEVRAIQADRKCNQVQECSEREHLARFGSSNKNYLIKSAGHAICDFWNGRLADCRRERKKKIIC